MALKFSGMFRGKDGSDYVSLKTPVTLIGSYEEFKTSIDNFYLKRILKEENIDQDNLKYASVYLFNTENTEEIVKCLNYLVTKKKYTEKRILFSIINKKIFRIYGIFFYFIIFKEQVQNYVLRKKHLLILLLQELYQENQNLILYLLLQLHHQLFWKLHQFFYQDLSILKSYHH